MMTLIIHSWALVVTLWSCSDLDEAIYERWGIKIKFSWLVYIPIINIVVVPVVIGYTFGFLKQYEDDDKSIK